MQPTAPPFKPTLPPILEPCPNCVDGWAEYLVSDDQTRAAPCVTCRGRGAVAVRCADCRSDDASVLGPDNVARCEWCAEAIAAEARALLEHIARRTVGTSVDLIVRGALRMVREVQLRRAS